MNAPWIIGIALSGSAQGAIAQCRLCPQTPQAEVEATRPLSIEVVSGLDFSRAAATPGGGSIAVNERSGARTVTGLVDLGGFAIKGVARLTGEPYAHVRVGMPAMVRMISSDGGVADAVDLRTDLLPDAALDSTGTLTFSFAGRLVVNGDAHGDFRGRFVITADYQ